MKNAALNKRKTIRKSVAAFLFLICAAIPAQALEKPKAVSLDYCADQILLSLADRDQIMALTTEAIESHSFYRDRAAGLPLFKATLEEVLHKAPDVVIRYWAGLKMLPLLKRANISVTSVQYGTDDKILYQNMRLVGAALGQEMRAEEKIRDHQLRMKGVKIRAAQFSNFARPIRVAYITPGGITAGENTFIDNLFKLAGFTPISQEFGLKGWQPIPLEVLMKNPPDLIVGSFFDLENYHISSWSLSRHDRIAKMINNIPTIMVPGRYLSCNGIFSVDAAEYIQAEAARLFIAPLKTNNSEQTR